MIYIRVVFFSFMLLFVSSCSAPKKQVVKKECKIGKIGKNETCKPIKSLDQSLRDIDARVGDAIFIRIFKEEQELELWVKSNQMGKFRLCKTFSICAYSGNLGPKLKQGDKQAPEGFYKVSRGQLKPNSRYHLAFNLGFPNRYDKNHGRTGSYLMVHGKCSSTGCYAMGNDQIEEIYKMAHAYLMASRSSFNVHIFPFRMTSENMYVHQSSKWYKFWVNLKLGYDIFENTGTVPIVKSPRKKYRFYLKKYK